MKRPRKVPTRTDGRETAVGCGGAGREAEEVKLFAGAGLRPAVEQLVAEFRKETGIVVVPDYAGSGTHISKARETSDLDLFMPGDVYYVNRLDEMTGRVETQTAVSWFVPVIIVQKGNPKAINSLADFFRDDVKVAMGNPKACQVGRIAGKILRKNGLNVDDLTDPMLSLTVNELGVWVQMKKVDAAVVWDAIAANIAEDVDVLEIPKDKNIISRVVVGLMKDAPRQEAARKFIQFMTSPRGRAILKSRGYRIEAP